MGSHCTRAEAPHDRCWQAHKGLTFNALRGWERDHFDRLVHLAYGLRPASEVTESLGRVVRVHSGLVDVHHLGPIHGRAGRGL